MKVHHWVKSRNLNLSVMSQTGDHPKGKPVIIYCHGFTGEKVGANRLHIQLANALADNGYSVVRFDFAGSGESDGDFATDTTLSGWKADLRNVIQWVRNNEAFQGSPILLMGHSLGGYMVLQYEEKEANELAARIALAPVADPAGNFKSTILGPDCWEQLENNQVISNFYGKGFSLHPAFLQDLLSYPSYLLEDLPYATPLLIIHGTGDLAVPAEGSATVFAKYKGTEKEIEFMEDVDHVFTGHIKALQSILLNWLGKLSIPYRT